MFVFCIGYYPLFTQVFFHFQSDCSISISAQVLKQQILLDVQSLRKKLNNREHKLKILV